MGCSRSHTRGSVGQPDLFDATGLLALLPMSEMNQNGIHIYARIGTNTFQTNIPDWPKAADAHLFHVEQLRSQAQIGKCSTWNNRSLSQIGHNLNSGEPTERAGNAAQIPEVFHRQHLFRAHRPPLRASHPNRSSLSASTRTRLQLPSGFPQLCPVLHSQARYPQFAVPFTLVSHG